MSAPPLVGDTWIGTGGQRLSLDDFKGRFLLLDFWTLCCVNCHHVLAELRPIEAEFADALTVVGVHSPKFEFEKDPSSVLSAVQRHGIDHPVLNDPNMTTWRAYGVRAWPTLVLIDPVGEVIRTWSGEGHGHAIAATLRELVPAYDSSGTLIRGAGLYKPEVIEEKTYLQPGKVEPINDQLLLVSDSGNHRLAIASFSEPNKTLVHIGTGERGLRDGSFATAQFNEPYGCVVLPQELAQRVGYHLIVADTANHVLRSLNTQTEIVKTIAGTGNQWRPGDPTTGKALEVPLSTPWDVELVGEQVFIAMAGEHRIWVFDPLAGCVSVAAGTTHEGLVDGPVDQAWFAQPSALIANTQGLWVLDSETSALRLLTDNYVTTEIGKGLFDFGHIDGQADLARLQHPLGLASDEKGNIYIADTYNGSIRHFDVEKRLITTVARDLAEPSDLCLAPDAQELLVIESARGVITRIPLADTIEVSGTALQTIRPELLVSPGSATLTVVVNPPPGQKRDDRYGPSTQLVVGSSPPGLLLSGAGTGTELTRELQINPEIATGVLHVAAKGASCDSDSANAACHIHQQDWGVPVKVQNTGTNDIVLTLAQ